jgi:16S rRNA (cytidine1402-2'-O)-methyltransferase
VDLILAEDTRRTRALLSHLGIAAGRRLSSLNEHNEARRVEGLVDRIGEGASAALVSDAGTPVLSDPGYRLVEQARQNGLAVRSVPGPSAFTAALAAAGQPPLPAHLIGFLPPRQGRCRRRISELVSLPGTLVILLSPHRLRREMVDLSEGLGKDRPATLLVELSKMHERAVVGSLGDLAEGEEVLHPRGEYVLVVAPTGERDAGDGVPDRACVRAAYSDALADANDRNAARRAVAARFGISRREVYELLIDEGEKP